MPTFTDYSTVVQASWLNHVDSVAYNDSVAALTGFVASADKLAYYTGPAAAALATFTATGRAIVGSATPAAVLSAIGGAPSDNPTFTGTVSAVNVTASGDVLASSLRGAGDLSSSSITGDLTIVGESRRFMADFSNATPSKRLIFQSSTVNGSTSVAFLPNGTSQTVNFLASAGSDLDNAAYIYLGTTAADLRIVGNKTGSASHLPVRLFSAGLQRMEWSTDGNIVTGNATGNDSRITVSQHRYLSNPYAVVLKSYSAASTFECDFFMGQTATGFEMGTYQSFPVLLRTANTERIRVGNDGKVTFTMPDSSGPQFLVAGTTKGVRFYTSSVGTAIEGVDYTGTGSYQPLIMGGTYISFGNSGSESARVTSSRTLASRTTGYMNRTSQSTSTTTHTIDWTASNYYQLTMGHNIATLTLTAPEYPCVVQLDIIQDGTGGRTMAWPASLKWPSSYSTADKTISTAINARDLLVLRWNGTDYVANLMKGIA